MEPEEEEEEEDFDFIPFLREDIPSDASSGLTSENEDTTQKHTLISQNERAGAGTAPETGTVPQNPNPYMEEEPGPSDHAITVEDEEAIARRTRARVSLENYSMDELEAFLQGSDDDADGQNVDEEEEYRRFLAAVLSDDLPYNIDEPSPADEDENDADFEAELEEALESDPEEEPPRNVSPNSKKRRPETRHKKLENNHNNNHNINTVGPSRSSLRPIIPITPLQSPQFPPNLNANLRFGFTEEQIAELNVIMNEHVQLLVQVFSISVLDPARQNVASETQGLIKELVSKREESIHRVSSLNGSGLSALDVEPLRLAKDYLDDVATSVYKYRHSQKTGTRDKSYMTKEPLFPLPKSQSQSQSQTGSDESKNKRKSMAATLVEGTKKACVALVPVDIARLAYRFYSSFNQELVPRKPPPVSVTNRLLFTDAEDRLLALGFLEYNNDWAAIQKRYLPCKSAHQIFVRAKNQRASKAPENPIKAVKRLKHSPLTAEEAALIDKGLKVFKNDWFAIWRCILPYRDPNLLPRQWQNAIGTSKRKEKKPRTEAEKSKSRIYEANRRQIKRNAQQDEGGGEGGEGPIVEKEIENNNNNNNNNGNHEEEAYVHEAFFADPERNVPLHLNIPNGPSISNNIITSRRNKGRVVKLAPGLPPVNLPRSVRVISHATLNLARNSPVSKDLLGASGRTIPPKQLNLFPNNNNNSRESNSDFQMHPLLFQSAPNQQLSQSYRPVPNNGTGNVTSGFSGIREFRKEVPENSSTVDFHPLLQRNESNDNVGENINLNIQLFSSMGGLVANNLQIEGVNANIGQFSEPVQKGIGNEIINEDSIQGIEMEQEELSDSEEESENVEFEREEIEDSDEDALESVQHFIDHNRDLENLEGQNRESEVQENNPGKSRGAKQRQNRAKGDNSSIKPRKSRAKSTKSGQVDTGPSKRKPRKQPASN